MLEIARIPLGFISVSEVKHFRFENSFKPIKHYKSQQSSKTNPFLQLLCKKKITLSFFRVEFFRQKKLQKEKDFITIILEV